MTLKTYVFEPGDATGFEPLSIFDEEAMERVVQNHASGASYVYTIRHHDAVIGVLGCSPLWKGRADVWSVLGNGIKKCPKDFSKMVGILLNAHQETLLLSRLECHVRADYGVGQKWIERFGFNREGLMKKFLPCGGDAYLYARVK
jgi:hypothetical protein